MIKDREEELLELDKRKKEEKEETIQIILKFFNLWGDLLREIKKILLKMNGIIGRTWKKLIEKNIYQN